MLYKIKSLFFYWVEQTFLYHVGFDVGSFYKELYTETAKNLLY